MKKIIQYIFLACTIIPRLASAQQVELITTSEQRAAYEGKSYLIVKSLSLKPGFIFNGSQGSFYAKVHPDATAPAAPSDDQNYVRTEAVQVPGITTETGVRALNNLDKATSFGYSDGAGKPLQSISIASTPAVKDVVQPTYYDALGRPERQYLPYTAGGTKGAYQASALTQQASFYNTPSDKVADETTRPFSSVVFDPAPGVNESRGVGAAFSNEPAYGRVKLNDINTVREWTLNTNGLPVSSAFYAAAMLTVEESEDEEGFINRTYTDWLGRVVLSETETTESRWAKTYYVYNEYGSILYVIPPAATSLTPDQTYADRWYFQTRYDDQQRKIATKTPGAGWVYTVYDQWDRIVLTQDAVQRGKTPQQEWSFVKYDAFNRPVVTGIYKTSETNVDNIRTSVKNSTGRYEARNTTSVGYSLNASFPTTSAETDLLSITYYDDYSYLSNTGWDAHSNSYAFVSESGYTGTHRNGSTGQTVLDLTTGGKVKVLNSDPVQWLNSVTWYDDDFRPLQTIAKNIFNKTDRITSEYDTWTGEVQKTKRTHVKDATETILHERYEYDHAGRLLKTWHQINSQPEVLLTSLEYNELGQVVDKKLHLSGSEMLQSVDYRYNVQGGLTHVNYTTPDAGDPVDYFSMELAYHNSLSTGNTAKHDGSITGMRWKHDLSDRDRVYNYTYDNKALTSGAYKTEPATTPAQTNVYTEEGIAYDLNGNITKLNRFAWNGVVAQKADSLAYNYGTNGGNQLMKVTENANTAIEAEIFNDGNTSGDDYVYDANGNLTEDKNKDFTIIYNLLDLPEKITLTDNSYITYTYDAGGSKLSEAYYNASHAQQYRREYASEFVYYSEADSATEPIFIHHTQGRLVPASYTNLINNTATREANTTDGYSANGSVTLTHETLNNETYVKAVCNQSTGTPGVYPIGGTIAVKPGESYSLKVLGYQSNGTTAKLYVKNANGSDILWPGATLPTSAGTEAWVTSTFTVPVGVTQIRVGVLWNTPASGNTLYINSIALYKTDWEYQYFLNDHLGSTRTVLQTTPHTFTYVATMESQNYEDESAQFFSLNSAREVASPGNATPGGSKAYRMDATTPVGPARSFRVLPGDVIDVSTMAWYASGGTYAKNNITAMATAVAGSLAGGVGAIVDGIGVSYNTSSNPLFVLSTDQGSTRPSAFINYILFNELYQPLEAKSQPVGATANAIHAVVLPTISVKETGYLFVYLSYDNTSGNEVHFDDFKITYKESPIVQINSYYPYGLTALSWTRDGEVANRYHYQSKGYETKTQLHDFHARQYDAALGRWFAVDPKNQFSSPYLAMGNNPIAMIDPDGKWVNFVVGAVLGGVGNYIAGRRAGLRGSDLFGFTMAGAIIGTMTAGVGSAVGGAVMSATSSSILSAASGAAAGGFVGGFYGAALSGGDPLRGGANGAISGLVGGLAGGAVGNGLGALLGGAASGATSAALNDGNIINGALLGGGIGFASYHTMALATVSKKLGSMDNRPIGQRIKEGYKMSRGVQRTAKDNLERGFSTNDEGQSTKLFKGGYETKYEHARYKNVYDADGNYKDVVLDVENSTGAYRKEWVDIEFGEGKVYSTFHTHTRYGTEGFSSGYNGDLSIKIPNMYVATYNNMYYAQSNGIHGMMGPTNNYLMRNIYGF